MASPLEAARQAQDAAQADTLINHDTPDKGYSKIYDTVTRCPDITDSAYRTYAILKTHDQGNGVFPGIHRLSCLQGVSHRTIQYNLDALVALCLVEKRRRGLGRTNEYHIADARMVRLSEERPITDVQPAAHQQRSGNVLHIKTGNPLHDHDATDCTSMVQPIAHRSRQSSKQTKTETNEERSTSGASAPRARTATARKHELDDETKAAARTFLDAFCQMWPQARQADPGWWGEAVKAVQDYPLPDLLALVAYKKSRGRLSDAIRPKHVAADMDGWVAVGRPAAAERVRSSSGQRDSNVGLGSTSGVRYTDQVTHACRRCRRLEGKQHIPEKGCPVGVVTHEDCVSPASQPAQGGAA